MSLLANVATFRNWHLPYCERWGLIRAPRVEYRLRQGLRFQARTRTYTAGTIKKIFRERIYEPDVLRLPEQGTVVDVGGHIGIFAAYAASRSPGVRVFTYEPEPENFQDLQTNIALNRLENVRAFPEAVGGTEGERTLYKEEGRGTGGHSIVFDWPGGAVRVRCTTLARILERVGGCIDFLKMNCEGGEYEILPPLSPEIFRKIRQIAIQVHEMGPGGEPSATPESLAERLRTNGFEVFPSIRAGFLYARRPQGQ